MAVASYTGTLPAPRTQSAAELNSAMETFITWLTDNAPEIAGHVAELAALASVAAYSSSTTYAVYECVYGPDGHTYRCIQSCSDVEPGVTSGWESYWLQLTIEPGPELASGVYLTGNIQGGNYSRASATTITVEAGRCVDDTDKYWIEWPEQTITVTVPSPGSQRHLFACQDGVVRDDSDVDGANLDYIKRYIGRFHGNAAGTALAIFSQNGDLYSFGKASEAPGQSLSTTSYYNYNFISNMDPERISEIEFAASVSSSVIVTASYDGTNVAFVVATGGTSTADTSPDVWGDNAAMGAGFKPCNPDMYFGCTSTGGQIKVRSIRMKR